MTFLGNPRLSGRFHLPSSHCEILAHEKIPAGNFLSRGIPFRLKRAEAGAGPHS